MVRTGSDVEVDKWALPIRHNAHITGRQPFVLLIDRGCQRGLLLAVLGLLLLSRGAEAANVTTKYQRPSLIDDLLRLFLEDDIDHLQPTSSKPSASLSQETVGESMSQLQIVHEGHSRLRQTLRGRRMRSVTERSAALRNTFSPIQSHKVTSPLLWAIVIAAAVLLSLAALTVVCVARRRRADADASVLAASHGRKDKLSLDALRLAAARMEEATPTLDNVGVHQAAQTEEDNIEPQGMQSDNLKSPTHEMDAPLPEPLGVPSEEKEYRSTRKSRHPWQSPVDRLRPDPILAPVDEDGSEGSKDSS